MIMTCSPVMYLVQLCFIFWCLICKRVKSFIINVLQIFMKKSTLNKINKMFYHDCIVPIPQDSDANFGLEFDVNCISFHLHP